jgi:hypothetical protein
VYFTIPNGLFKGFKKGLDKDFLATPRIVASRESKKL